MLSLLALCLQQVPVAPEEQQFRPNVVVILIDDVGIDLINAYREDVPCTGTPLPPGCSSSCPEPPLVQPAIDYLASRGLRFRNAWSNPLCTPTRSLLLTGKPAHLTGVGGNPQFDGSPCPALTRPGLQPNEVTLPGMLRPFYTSAAIGKWHASDECRVDRSEHPTDWYRHPLGICSGNPWFDLYAGCVSNMTNAAGTGPNDWIKMFSTPIDPLSDECVAPCSVPLNSNSPSPCSDCSRYGVVDTAQDAIHLLQTLPEPFFLYTNFNAPHVPLDEPDPTCCPEGLEPHSCPGRFTTNPECPFTGDPVHDTRCLLQLLDSEIGSVLCEIDESDTYVFLVGDNGTGAGAVACPFDTTHHKGTLYQGGVRVPLIIAGPGIAGGGEACDALVSNSDLVATICELAGVPLPLDPELDSVSFARNLYRPEAPSRREFAYAELFEPSFIPNRLDPMDECSTKLGGPPAGYSSLSQTRAIRNERFKLIEWWEACDPITGTGLLSGQPCLQACDSQVPKCLIREEFYDLAQDFYEQVNLAANIPPGQAQVAYNKLKDRLTAKYPLLP